MINVACFCLPFAAAGLFWLATRRPAMRGKATGGTLMVPPVKGVPSLFELGMTKDESARAQKAEAK